MKDFRASTLIAGIALFVLIGGTATAASGLISGKQIKKGTVTAKQIKNKTITTAKLAPSTVKSLKGKTGPQGTPGAPGATGLAGADGAVSPIFAEDWDVNLANSGLPDPFVLLEMNVPAGDYILTAKANVISNQANADLNCSIWIDETSAVDEANAGPLANNEVVPLSLTAVTGVEGKVDFRCNGFDVAGSADDIKLIALPVQG